MKENIIVYNMVSKHWVNGATLVVILPVSNMTLGAWVLQDQPTQDGLK